MKKHLSLFLTMLKIGLFTFGGGYAMISLLQNAFVEKKKYLEKDEFLDMVAIAESTPGPIAINAATYIGYKHLGILGSLLATVAICIPSFVIIFAISLFLDTFLAFKPVEYAFRGIQVCVVYLIFSAGLKMLKQIKKNAFSVIVIIFTPFRLHISIIGRSSAVLPPRDARTITSPFLRNPVPPCTASAGDMNFAGCSMQFIR